MAIFFLIPRPVQRRNKRKAPRRCVRGNKPWCADGPVGGRTSSLVPWLGQPRRPLSARNGPAPGMLHVCAAPTSGTVPHV
jgi:hypothetical protein